MVKNLSRIIILIMMPALISQCSIMGHYFKSSEKQYSGTIHIEGLKQPVEVRYDNLGIPHIKAHTEEDLFLATGYVMASYRLFQMVMIKMAIQGRLSEFAGKDALPIDYFMRSLNAKKMVAESMRSIDSHGLMMFTQFAKGVNAYIKGCKELPPEFILAGFTPDEWQPEDGLYIFGMLNLDVSFNFIEELQFLMIAQKLGLEKACHLFPVYKDTELPFEEAKKLRSIITTIPQIEEVSGTLSKLKQSLGLGIPASNNWAIAPTKTNGKSIVANDTHLMASLPSPWIIMHLECPTYHCAGVCLPGIPIVVAGYNGHVAWGETMVMADTQDIFIEKIKEEKGNLYYLYKGEWVPVEKHEEVFTVKGKKHTVTMYSTVHGPLLNMALLSMPFPPKLPVQPPAVDMPYGLALSWVVAGGDKTLNGFYTLGKAKTLAQAREAMKHIQTIYLNIVYGDSNSIGWQVTGLYPVRKKGTGLFPSPGWTGEYDWDGFVPFDRLPHVENPEEGFVVTANHRTVAKDYPVNLTQSWYNDERAMRITQVLSHNKTCTLEDVMKLQNDQYSLMAKHVQDILFSKDFNHLLMASLQKLSPKQKEKALKALQMLSPEKFDCIMRVDSAQAALMGALYHCFVHNTFADELGPKDAPLWEAFLQASMTSYSAFDELLAYKHQSPFFDDVTTPEVETKWDVLAKTLADAYVLCQDTMGRNEQKWQWGKLHAYWFKHEIAKEVGILKGFLSRGPYPAGGDVHTVNVAMFTWGKDFDVWMIPAMRMIVDFNSNNPLHFIIVPGQSGNPVSRHYDDMVNMYLHGTYQVIPMQGIKDPSGVEMLVP
ncbi:MAG TPA: penicillin acylase family protein [Spirochaetota bacterium]|nr:penicillin acylase family protein [Spirochaetota bacterium]HOM09839.1 penicillin acylase family protein [Spirochaetota bacterium]HPP49693.1 penicillin acylase family protein [Spirochaetota bacterium]